MAASLLRTAGLPELVAGMPGEYESKAAELAMDPTGLGEARRKLAQRTSPLFDTAAYTRNLESPYEAVYERYQSGLSPAHLNEGLAG